MPTTRATDKSGFEPLPDGDYSFTIVYSQLERTSKDDDMIRVRLKEKHTGKLVFDQLVFKDHQLCRKHITNFWRGLGHQVKENEDIGFEANEILDRDIRAHITTHEYNGDLQNDVAWYLIPDPKQLSAEPTPDKRPIRAQPF